MKVKLVLAAIVLLIVAQILFGGRKKATPASPAATAQSAAVVSVAGDDAAPTPAETLEAPPATKTRPEPDDITEISVGSGDSALHLERLGDDWDVVGAVSAPADSEKVEKLLAGLLRGELRPLPESARVTTGLEDGGGLPIRLTTGDNGGYEMRIGMRPEDRYDAVYASLPGGGIDVLSADVRGELGLWKNDPDLTPDASAWFEKTVLKFDPAGATRLEASYPDHRIVFEKDADGEWHAEGYVPGGDWSREGLDAWLRDLSAFRITGVEGTGELPKDPQKLHEIKITLGEGVEKTIRVAAHHMNESMVAESSDFPGRMFTLPDWRFRKYFRRLPWLFPKAVPHFELRDVLFLDIRQDGETVKFANRPDGWHAVASAYPVRVEAIERLVRALSTLRPEDYAAPDFKTIRPLFAGPLVETILAGGDVHQYRLAGRHPLFPWRYIILDGKSIFSITDAEASVLFPGFAEVLDLGRVMPRRHNEDIQEIQLEEGGDVPTFTLRRKEDGNWEAGYGERLVDVDREKTNAVVDDMLDWSIAGFYNLDARKSGSVPMYRLHVTDKEKSARNIQFLEPEERDIPYILDNGRAFLLDRKEFFNWLGEMRALAAETEATAHTEEEPTPEPDADAPADSVTTDELIAEPDEATALEASEPEPEPEPETEPEPAPPVEEPAPIEPPESALESTEPEEAEATPEAEGPAETEEPTQAESAEDSEETQETPEAPEEPEPESPEAEESPDAVQPLPIEEVASDSEAVSDTATPPEEPAEADPTETEEAPAEQSDPEMDEAEENPDDETPAPLVEPATETDAQPDSVPDAEGEIEETATSDSPDADNQENESPLADELSDPLSDDEPQTAIPPVEIPMSTPSAHLDDDLIHPLPADAISPEATGSAEEVERFVDGFIEKIPNPLPGEDIGDAVISIPQ